MPRTSLWAAAGLLVLTSCFNPSFESGRSACGAGGECPSGLACDLSSRLCFTPGTAPDASIDVLQPDGPLRGNVTIVVQDQSGVASNRPVLFNEPDGTTAVVNTDADGRVVREIPEGTTVTSFIRPNEGDQAFLLTYAGVMPGETVRMTVFRVTEPTPPSATVTYPGTFSRPADGAAADNYLVDLACTSNSNSTSPPPPVAGMAVRQDCHAGDRGWR